MISKNKWKDDFDKVIEYAELGLGEFSACAEDDKILADNIKTVETAISWLSLCRCRKEEMKNE